MDILLAVEYVVLSVLESFYCHIFSQRGLLDYDGTAEFLSEENWQIIQVAFQLV